MKLGILGGGQLGRMLALSAHPLGIRPLIVDPTPSCSASAAAETISADWHDPAAFDALARCDVVTYEFENTPTDVVERLAERVQLHPTPAALVHASDRLLEKEMLAEVGLPTARHRAIDTESDLRRAVAQLGLPAILKTRRFGYDGRGQLRLDSGDDVGRAWADLGGQPLILEAMVPFDREVSLLAVRSVRGEVRFWAPTENCHVDGVLRISRPAAPMGDDPLLQSVRSRVAALMTRLDYVGVMAVEFFVCGDEWIANEIACRVHNSGHWTIEGAATSQFENHVRAVAGLPLGSTRTVAPTAMINLIGALPRPEIVLGSPEARLHVYGKSPAPGRKLGHVTVSARDRDLLERRLEQVVQRLRDPVLAQALAPMRPAA